MTRNIHPLRRPNVARRPTILLATLAAALALAAPADAAVARDECAPSIPEPVLTPAPIAVPDPGATIAAQLSPPTSRRFEGYMAWFGCSRGIALGQRGRLVFTDNVAARTRYRVCLTRPSGRRLCQRRTAASVGEPSRVTFRARERGRYRAEWYVAGRRRARWTFGAEVGLDPMPALEAMPPPNDGRAPGQVPADMAVSGARSASDGPSKR